MLPLCHQLPNYALHNNSMFIPPPLTHLHRVSCRFISQGPLVADVVLLSPRNIFGWGSSSRDVPLVHLVGLRILVFPHALSLCCSTSSSDQRGSQQLCNKRGGLGWNKHRVGRFSLEPYIRLSRPGKSVIL